MKVNCENCGEELLGAVNRCWRCGTVVASAAVEVDLPPIRRTPPVRDGQMVATDDDTTGAGEDAEQRAGDATPDAAELSTSNAGTDQPPVVPNGTMPAVSETADEVIPVAELRGRPNSDANRSTTPPSPTSSVVVGRGPRTAPSHPAQSANAGGAIASLCLGGVSFLFSYFTPLALVPAVVGLAMGIWGMYSTRRGMAFAGAALCCIALAISGFNGLVDLYTFQYGHAPWDASDDFEIYDEAYFEEKGDL